MLYLRGDVIKHNNIQGVQLIQGFGQSLVLGVSTILTIVPASTWSRVFIPNSNE